MTPTCEGKRPHSGRANKCRADAVKQTENGPRCFRCIIQEAREGAKRREGGGMSELLKLAERCEAATGPDRELSAAIALAVHDWLHEVEGNKPLNCRVRNSLNSPVYIGGFDSHMDYTASLDAAMTLVPEGWHTFLAQEDRHSHSWRWDLRGGLGWTVAARCPNPALALCAASLRALASLQARGEQA